ncbi:hypothetical protein U1Q18_048967, partial [Sarracenia purpurea var. burkii]
TRAVREEKCGRFSSTWDCRRRGGEFGGQWWRTTAGKRRCTLVDDLAIETSDLESEPRHAIMKVEKIESREA